MAQSSGQDQSGSSCLLCSFTPCFAASGQGGTLAFPVSPHLHRENMWGVSLLVQAQVGGGTMIILSKSSLRVVLVNSRALMASLEAG